MSRGNAKAECAWCERFRPIAGRGLCGGCYHRGRVNGTLPERRNRANAEVVEEAEFLTEQGYAVPQVAQVLGMSVSGIEKAIERRQAA